MSRADALGRLRRGVKARRPSRAARRATGLRSTSNAPASSSSTTFVTASRNQRSCATIMIPRVERLQLALQPLEAFDVEVVGRLVEEQEVRIAAERARERGARQLAAGEGLELAVELLVREAETAHDRGRALAPVVAAGMLEPRLRLAVPANRRVVVISVGHRPLEPPQLVLQRDQVTGAGERRTRAASGAARAAAAGRAGRHACPSGMRARRPEELVSPTSARSSVVLPAPFGPASATRSRRSTLNDTPSNSGSPRAPCGGSMRSGLPSAGKGTARGPCPRSRHRHLLRAGLPVRRDRRGAWPARAARLPGRERPGTSPRACARRDRGGGRRRSGRRGRRISASATACSPRRARPALDPDLCPGATRAPPTQPTSSGRVSTTPLCHSRTGCQIHTSYWPAKLAWLAQEDPDVSRSAHRFVSFCDYLYAQLLGREVPTGISHRVADGPASTCARERGTKSCSTRSALDAERLPEILGCAGRRLVPGAARRRLFQLRRGLRDPRARRR